MANKKQPCTIGLPQEIRLEIQNGLLEYGKVKVVGLGIFETKRIPSRPGRNPQTGFIVDIPAYFKIKFRPTKRLRKSIC